MRVFMPFVAVMLLVAGLPPSLRAEEPVSIGQHVIQQQIEAFLHDDAKAAYSYASPAIKERFADHDIFFDMVKRSYGPVYSPGNYAFGRSAVSPDDSIILQEVLITDKGGKSWRAIYQLTRQEDGSYKVNGVQISEDDISKGI